MKVINKRKIGGFQNATPIDVKEEIGQITEGIYKGFTPIPSDRYKGKINNLYFIEIEGTLCSFFGGAGLERRLSEVKIGDWVSLTYNGLVRLKSGNKLHDFEVETGEVVEDDEEETPKPKITKPKAPKKTTPVHKEDTDEGEGDDDIPF